LRRTALVAAIALAAGLLVPAAGADRGVSVDLGRIAIDQKLQAGGSYALPTMGVRNPGTEPTSYLMGAQAIRGSRSPDEKWFEFSPRELRLEPGESRQVRTRLRLPTGADPGDYEALLGAQIVSDGGGVQVGAAAAARLTFSVEPSSQLAAWWLSLKAAFTDALPWSALLPTLAALGLGLAFVRKRFAFRVERRS
jgi:hypothetical protein